MRKIVVAAGCFAALASGGCGGSGSTTTASVDEFKACISQSFSPETPLSTSSDEGLDFIALAAGVGAIQVTSPKNEVQVVAERSSSDADKTAGEYEAFDLAQVDQFGTVVVAYSNTPIPQESEPIEDCLGEQGIG